MADLTSYLNDTKAKLGNQGAVIRSHPNYYVIENSTVKEYLAPEGGEVISGVFYTNRLVATHAFANVPDPIASALRFVLDRRLQQYNLNTPKPQ